MRYIFLIAFYFIFSFVQADDVILNAKKEFKPLPLYTYTYDDVSDTADLSDVMHVRWNTPAEDGLNFGIATHPEWLKIHLVNPDSIQLLRYIYIPYHHINYIDAYLVHEDSVIHHLATGTARPYHNKPILSRGYPIKLNLNPNQSVTVFIRLDHRNLPLRASMFLLSEDNLHESISSFEGLMWFWKGVIATAALLSLVTFIFVRTRLFLYYGILLIGIVLFIGLEIGDYFQFFEVDPRNTIIDIKHLGNILVIYSFPMFVNELSPVRKLHPRLWKWTMFLIIPFVFLFLLVLIDPLKDTILLFIITNYAIYISALIFFMQLVFLSSAAIQKRKNALLLVIIYTIYVAIFFITNSLPNLGIISDESVNVYAILLISSIMEVLTFLILIARETFHIYRERTQLMEQRRNHQRNLLLATVDSQERERNKVGRELHDMVGANMAVIKQKVDKQNKELRNILHHTIEVIRNLSHGLMTPHVKQEEFADEISELCILSSTEKLVVRSYFHNWEGFRINKESATHLYRIVQELLQNAIKHSQANRIYIQFLVEDSKLILMYDDNGIGFGDNSHFRKGIGLMNIESRVKLLNGEIDYNNKPDTEGVSVMMEFPEFQN